MNYNFTKIFIIFLSLFYVIIIGLIIHDSCFNSTVVKDVTMITTSFFTLIIAVLLYDRFNYRKIIFEKKLELVLKLLEKLKTTKVQVSYVKINEKSFVGVLEINKQNICRYQKSEHFNPNALIVFELQVRNYWNEISDLKNNPYMPKEISKSLDFLSFNYLEMVSNNEAYMNEYIQISINNNPHNLKNLDDWTKTEINISFNNFTNGFLNCLIQIEEWINKHSNFKADLNI